MRQPAARVLDAAIDELVEAYRVSRPRSAERHVAARRVIPGGNTRSVLGFEPFPFRVELADGSHLLDVDGHTVVDFCGNYTAGLLGHKPASVRAAVVDTLDHGWAFGATHVAEIELAELLCHRYESIEQVRFTNSGTEANLMAIGTSLHHTGRSKVVVFDGAYHGGVLSFLSVTGTQHSPLNVPYEFLVGRFDHTDSIDEVFGAHEVACVLVEPVQGAGGGRPASLKFLAALRDRCTESRAVLIFDEIMTSRLAPGGAQELFGVVPDVTTLGKYLAGGMTFGAFGGRTDIMAHFDPVSGGGLTHAGTFNNNAVSMAAAVATLRNELDPERLRDTNARGDNLRGELTAVFRRTGVPLWVTGMGSMIYIHAEEERWWTWFFHAMLADGHYLSPGRLLGLSMAISDRECGDLVQSARAWSTRAAQLL